MWQAVSADQARELLLANKNIQILDLRTAGEFSEGCLIGAHNIDFLGVDFADRLNELPKDRTYLVHCWSGKRSTAAREIFQKLGFTGVLHLKDGIAGWV